MRLYRVTEVSSSVQSVFITEETNFQSVTLLKQKLAILLPQRQKKRKIPSTIFIHHRHSEGRTIEKIHLIIHICIMFYIGPSVVTSELLLFFLFFNRNDEKRQTMKLSTCMKPHWEEEWEKKTKKTGTDHQLQQSKSKSLIASHFRIKKERVSSVHHYKNDTATLGKIRL